VSYDAPGRREAAVEMNRSRQLDDAQYIGESVHSSDRAMLEPRTRKLDARPFNVVDAVVILAPCLKTTKRSSSDRRNEVHAGVMLSRFDAGHPRCMRLLKKSQAIS